MKYVSDIIIFALKTSSKQEVVVYFVYFKVKYTEGGGLEILIGGIVVFEHKAKAVLAYTISMMFSVA